MKTTRNRKYRMNGLLGGLIVLAATAFAQEEAPLISELLEEGVYQEEANGDLDAAIALYQQIVDLDQVSRPKAAEAQYRLAVCYQKQGNQTMAVQAFEALIDKYPNQTEWIEAALVHIPKPFVPEDIPWVDGETTIMEIRLPTGMVVGYNYYRTEEVRLDGRDLWRMTNRTLASVEMVTRVEIDPVTQLPVSGYMYGYNPDMGEVSWWFEDGRVRTLYGDNPEPKYTSIEGKVIDNLQAQFLVRQFPLEVGFSTDQTIYVGMTGNLMPVTFTNLDIEEIETPLGLLECIRTEIDLGVQKQYFWSTTDATRRVVKLQAGGVEFLATRVEVALEDDRQTFRHDGLGFEVILPASWGVFNPPDNGSGGDRTRIELREVGEVGTFTVTARRIGEDDETAGSTSLEAARADAEKQMESYKKRKEDFVIDEASWQDLELAGGVGVSVSGRFTDELGVRVVKKICLRTGDLAFYGTMRSPEDSADRDAALLDQVMAALRID